MARMTYEVRKSRQADAVYLARYLRKEDVEEVWASSRRSPLQALTRAIDKSQSWTLVVGGEVKAVFGVGPDGQGRGVPWMLRQDSLGISRRDVMVLSQAILGWFLETYPVLINATNNPESERWLSRLGFTLGEPFPIDHKDGEAPVLFRVFHIERSSPCVTS